MRDKELIEFEKKLEEQSHKFAEENIARITEHMCQGVLTDEDVQDFLSMQRSERSEEYMEKVARYFEIMTVRALDGKSDEVRNAYNFGVVFGSAFVNNAWDDYIHEQAEFKAMSENDKAILLYLHNTGGSFAKEILKAVEGVSYKRLKKLADKWFLNTRKIGRESYYSLSFKGERYIKFLEGNSEKAKVFFLG